MSLNNLDVFRVNYSLDDTPVIQQILLPQVSQHVLSRQELTSHFIRPTGYIGLHTF